MHNENWLPVPGYEDFYIVSNLGNFRRVAPAKGANPGKNLTGGTMARGYRTIVFYRSPSDRKIFKLSRIVASVFLGPSPTPTHQVNHKNGIRDDDRAENLEWVTPSENVRHRFDVLGLGNVRGEAHHAAKLTEALVGAIKAARMNSASYGMIADAYSVSKVHVKAIVAGRLWSHVAATASEVSGQKARLVGINHPAAKVTPEIVRKIRASSESGVSLAKRFGVTSASISAIRKRKAWAHVA